MVKPNEISEVAVRTQAIRVRSYASRVRSAASLVASRAAMVVSSLRDGGLKDRELHQLRVAPQPELSHHLVLVEGHRAGRQAERGRRLLHRAPLGQEPEDLSLPRGQLGRRRS